MHALSVHDYSLTSVAWRKWVDHGRDAHLQNRVKILLLFEQRTRWQFASSKGLNYSQQPTGQNTLLIGWLACCGQAVYPWKNIKEEDVPVSSHMTETVSSYFEAPSLPLPVHTERLNQCAQKHAAHLQQIWGLLYLIFQNQRYIWKCKFSQLISILGLFKLFLCISYPLHTTTSTCLEEAIS